VERGRVVTALSLPAAPRAREPRHVPRHAAPHSSRTRKAVSAVSRTIRIPKPVNAALDRAAAHPAATLAGAVLTAAVAAFGWRPDLSLLTVCVAAAYALGAARCRGQVRRLRAELGDRERENARLTERLRHVERGDASATTARLFTIPETGEHR